MDKITIINLTGYLFRKLSFDKNVYNTYNEIPVRILLYTLRVFICCYNAIKMTFQYISAINILKLCHIKILALIVSQGFCIGGALLNWFSLTDLFGHLEHIANRLVRSLPTVFCLLVRQPLIQC